LAVGYLMISAFAGFSILLSAAILMAIYGLFDPAYGSRRSNELKDRPSVS